MTWLSEIEYTRLLIDRPPRGGWRKEMARMACGLRELVGYIRFLEGFPDPGMSSKIEYADLSPDAKELLKCDR